MIYVECKPDRALVSSTGIKDKIIHAGNKSGVCKRLEKNHNSVGIIDEDPGAPQPPYIERLKKEEPLGVQFIVLRDTKRNNVLIVLCPKLEEWVLTAAKEAGLAVSEYKLPSDAEKLHRTINVNLEKFERLLGDMKGKSLKLKKLRQHLILDLKT